MKKIIIVIGVIVILVVIVGGYFMFIKKKPPQPEPKVETFKVELPTGEVVEAIRIPREILQKPVTPVQPTQQRVHLILKGKVVEEIDERNIKEFVFVTDTGKRYVIFNPPYVNTLIFQARGKTVKIKGYTFGITSFKNYPGFYIEDILEIE